jgi:hypothetical protein
LDISLKTKIKDVVRSKSDADTIIVSEAIDIAISRRNIIVISDDTDVKIMLLYLNNSEMGDIFVRSFASKKKRSPDIDIGKTSNSLNHYVLKYLLVIPAFSATATPLRQYSTKEKPL